MQKQERYTGVCEAMEFHKWSEDREGYIIKTDYPDNDVRTELLRLIYDENVGGTSDLSYEIVAKACGLIEEIGIENMENVDVIYDIENEYASVYMYPRLQYLNINNQQEVTDVLKEYDADIQQACAIWYDKTVQSTAETLRDFITTSHV